MQSRDEVDSLHYYLEFSQTLECLYLSTDQSKRTLQNLVMACLQLVYLYVTQPCLHTLMQPRLSANQSARTILVIREFKINGATVATTPQNLHT